LLAVNCVVESKITLEGKLSTFLIFEKELHRKFKSMPCLSLTILFGSFKISSIFVHSDSLLSYVFPTEPYVGSGFYVGLYPAQKEQKALANWFYPNKTHFNNTLLFFT